MIYFKGVFAIRILKLNNKFLIILELSISFLVSFAQLYQLLLLYYTY